MSKTPHDRDDDAPEISTWLSEGGADSDRNGPITKAEILSTLDFLAAHTPGYPLASKLAAAIAAGIRVRGIARE